MAEKDIKYVGRDFDGFRANLMEFAKNYFPTTYNDFSTSSPGQMFIEMASYVGDVLSYYTDYALKESMIHKATERKNLYDLAQAFGYKPKISVASTCKLDVYLKIPSTFKSTDGAEGSAVASQPDWDYAPIIEEGMVVKTEGDIKFRTVSAIDFQSSSSLDPTNVTVHTANATTGQPEFYLLKKSVTVISGETKTTSFTGNNKKSQTFTIPEDNVIEIVSCLDSDNNKWYEVPFLAQDTVFEENVNNNAFDPSRSTQKVGTPYILSLRKTGRRFVVRVNDNNRPVLQFGSGISSNSDVSILPNPNNVGSNLPGSSTNLNKAFDPSNFMFTKSYGKAPDSSMTITYTVGKGLDSNVEQGLINKIESKTLTQNSDQVTPTLLAIVEASLAVDNPEPARGGKSQESLEEIRQNALGHFATQRRAVTREDYIIRAYSMPSKFGSVEKVFITNDTQIDEKTKEEVANPMALNMYTLGYNNVNNLTAVNEATKNNLKNYLSQHRILTDAVNIKDGYIINLGVDFEIVALAGFNSREVVLKCIEEVKRLMHIDRMQFNQPIIIKDLTLALAKVDGVQSVMKFDIINKWRTSLGYSGNKYNLEDANRGGVIYPSLDPSVFEIKYPNIDIQGRATTY
tara:strand:+ start:1623 stop:3506 length:1884 start_codon:yes stop_codon:yes gene_type:complete